MIPSLDLPPVSPIHLEQIVSSLSSLQTRLDPSHSTIDLRQPLEVIVTGDTNECEEEEEERDVYEEEFALNWVRRVLVLATKQQGRVDEAEALQWEAVMDRASSIISRNSGPGASAETDTFYLLPSPPSSHLSTPQSDVSIKIHSGTLLAGTTGHRTWGSAPILARRIAINPERFFPVSPPLSTPLRVLELGAGTGLVGLAALSTLQRLGVQATIHLTDGGESQSHEITTNRLVDNLAFNLQTYLEQQATGQIEAANFQLCWDDYLEGGGGGTTIDSSNRYDVILGADLVYEPQQAKSLHAAVAAHLRFPSTSPSLPPPSFHLIIPLRPTHTTES
ncbi:hypothetical protein JCM5353_003477, partial [Sporobolomyces roseus]